MEICLIKLTIPVKLMPDNIFSDLLLPITLVIITFGLGLSLTTEDFKNIALYPRALITGLLSQLLLLPLIAFGLSTLTHLEPVYKIGLIIIAACPGGATANLVNFILRGNVALSLSITVINGIITIFTIPLIVGLGLFVFMHQQTEFHLPFADTIFKIFILTVVPASLGVTLRHWKTKFAVKVENPLRYILPILLLGVYAGVIFLEQDPETTDIGIYLRIFPWTFALNILSMATGIIVGHVMSLTRDNQYTIAVEVGLQNSTLAIFVASTLLGSPEMSLVAVVYGSFSFFSTLLFGYLVRKFRPVNK